MGVERRKAKRQNLGYGAHIVSPDGALKRDCVISDISATGAKLTIDKPIDIPDEFVLMLTERGTSKRFCTVAWRTEWVWPK